MKSFDIEISDLQFIEDQTATPIVRIVRYEPTTGTAIYGFTEPDDGDTIELGALGTFDLLDPSSQWRQYIGGASFGANIDAVTSPYGLRNVSGLFNNVSSPDTYGWGAVSRPFLRQVTADYTSYLQQNSTDRAFYAQRKTSVAPGADQATIAGLAGKSWQDLTVAQKQLVQNSNWTQTTTPTGRVDNAQRYANPFLTVYDDTPRSISQLVSSANGDNSAFGRIEAAAPGTITDVTTFTKKDAAGKDIALTEKFQRNVNTESGGMSLSGWNTLFGQFFDHGLDSIGKGGNKLSPNGVGARVIIPLAPDDPLYAFTPPNADGVRALSIPRATVANPEQAGADGKFGTSDDLVSPGVDGKYGTADDVLGLANPEYDNHVSPYIDQSQTYGSIDDVTDLLREWVIDPTTGKYLPGMRLFNGTTLATGWQRTNPDGSVTTTKDTLPTLNELRAYLHQTGRDDLTWDDISNFHARDAQGKVLDLDGNPNNGIQTKATDNALLLDFLPRLDLAHLNASGLTDFKSLFPSFSGNIADYVNVNSGQPTPLGIANADLVNELLLRSIGDHYIAGDGRVNENFGLTAIHHVWHEDHNWQIDNLIQAIDRQQASDPGFAHAWQTAVTATGAPVTGISIVNGHYEDAKGNYTDSTGKTNWNQEKMFQSALAIVQMEYQHVAIDQYARGMSPNIPEFEAYDPTINADVSLEYSQAAFRFGHSQLRETIDTLDPNGSLSGLVTKYALEQAFLTPSQFAATGPTAIAQGMTRQVSSEIDEIITPTLQQALLGQPQDLAAINIARGRDLGIPTLNTLRRSLYASFEPTLTDLKQQLSATPNDTKLQAKLDRITQQQLGLTPYTSWDDFGNNLIHPAALVNFMAAYSFGSDLDKASAIVKLSQNADLSTLTDAETTAYQNLGWTAANARSNALNFIGSSAAADKGFENIDTWIGGLAEKHVPEGELGATFDAVFADQMTRLINGDRFYYFWRLQLGLPEFPQLLDSVTSEQFKDVIERTTGARHLTGDVFFATDSHIELGEDPTLTKNNNATPDAIEHRYGDKVASLGLGVYSSGGKDTAGNGNVIQLEGVNFDGIYINDTGPDSSDIDPQAVNPDGTPTYGFNSHETIGGTKFADYIDAGDGDDTVFGGDGNDILIGGDGADHLYGENGDDTIYGGGDDNFIDGGEGNDRIYGGDDDGNVLIGGNGNDRIYGGINADEIHGNNGDDSIEGGLGDDTVFGGYGNDIIDGGAGTNSLYGEWGDDIIYGGAGEDLINGGVGNDLLSGGEGNDTYLFNLGFGRDTIVEAGTSKLDTVKFGGGLTLDKFDFSRQGTDLVLKVKGTNDTLTIRGQFGAAGTTAVERFEFDNGAITLTLDELLKNVSVYPVTCALVGAAKNLIKLGSDRNLQFSIKQDKSNLTTQIGCFKVDDLNGTIDGAAPTADNYMTRALNKSQLIFGTIATPPQGFDRTQLHRTITGFQPDDLLGFYAIQDDGASGKKTTFFGTDPQSQTFTASDIANNTFNLNWHSADNRSLNLDLTVRSTLDTLPIGATPQESTAGSTLDFSQIVAPTVKVNCNIYRDAAYNDAVGFYQVIDASGAIQTSQGVLKPGDAGYLQAAINNALDKTVGSGLDLGVSDRGTKTIEAIFGKSIYLPIIVSDGTLAEAARGQKLDRTYTAFLGANSDKADHIRLLGDNTFGFEDLVGGGDRDFNDIIINIKPI